MRAQRIGLGLLAAVLAISLVAGIGFWIKVDSLIAQLRNPSLDVDFNALDQALSRWADISAWSQFALAALAAGAIGLLAFSLPAGAPRRLAAAGAALGTLFLAVFLFDQLAKMPAYPRTGEPASGALQLRRALWLLEIALDQAAPALAVLGVLRSLRARWGAATVLLAIYAVLSLAFLVMVGQGIYSPSADETMRWIRRSSSTLADAAMVAAAIAALRVHQTAASGPGAEPVLAGGGSILRLLAGSLLARIALGIAVQIPLLFAMRERDFSGAKAWMTLGTVGGLLTGVCVLLALIGYLRLPERLRSGGALGFAIGALVLGAILDLYAASAASELFEIGEQMTRATSFWNMPSLSRLEELQAGLTWGGRIALALGIAAGFALAHSLQITALAFDAADRVAQARRVKGFLVGAGGGALALGTLAQELREPVVLLVGAIVLLVIALMLLVDWVALLLGLAKCLDHPDPAAR